MRLIDANELLELYDIGEELEEYAGVLSVPIPVIRQNIKDMPTIDAVPVVRCKDCKHLMFSDCYGECGQGHMGIVKPWDFCSYGKREGNES